MTDVAWREVGERMREARTARGLGQQTLGAAMRLERTAVAKIEAGQRRMTAIDLVAASNALRVPMSWLAVGPEPAMVSRRVVLDESDTAAVHEFDVDTRLHQAWEATSLLARDGHLRPVELPTTLEVETRDEAEDAAAVLRSQLGLTPVEPLANMADVAARFGLHVFVEDSPVDGHSMTPRPGLGVAVLGGRPAPARRRFTCAHEIGHHVLGDEYDRAGTVADSRDDREGRIDAFAAALLLPPPARTATTRDEMVVLAGRFRVSWSLAVEACGRPAVGGTPLRADFVAAGIDVPEDLLVDHPSSVWRSAVLAARSAGDLTDEAALGLLGKPALSLEDLPPLDAPAW